MTSVVWIKVLELGLKMNFALIFLYIEACWLGSAPLLHLIKEMRQKTEYVTKSLYIRVLISD